MKITAIRQEDRTRDRVRLYIDGEPSLTLSAEAVLREGLRPDRVVDEPLLRRLESEDWIGRAREMALHLLALRARSEHEIRQRLRQRAFPAEAIDVCIAYLRERALLDDAEFARAFTRDRIRLRGSGPLRISAELRARGIEHAIVEQVISEAFHELEQSEIELARAASDRFARRPGESVARQRRRLSGFLARRGFSGETVAQIIEEWND